MNSNLPIKDLCTKVLEELSKLNYSYHSICGYRSAFRRIVCFADNIEEQYFSEEFGHRYLSEKYDCSIDYYLAKFPKRAKHAIRTIRLLGDYQLHGVILRRIVKKKNYVKPKQFEAILDSYENECKENEYSLRGMRTRLHRLFFFIDYLSQKNIQDVNEITPLLISDYVKTICHNHEKSIASILTTLRVFLRFLYLNQFIKSDLSLSVPKQNRYYYPPIPSVWQPEDIKKLINSIDCESPMGKRDYAILLLVSKLGIRAGDIKALMLNNLDWNKMQIRFIQQKTGVFVTYPILKDIGWALIDYIKYGRPANCSSPFIFVRMKAPYEAFGKDANLYNVITKYTRAAGIKILNKRRHGLHSLRHTLASSMLEKDVPLSIISDILGHTDAKSTAIYLRTDLKGLKECALDPVEIVKND